MNRTDFRNLTRTRLAEAELLFQAAHYDGAYYLFGLAIECALKACISRKIRRFDFPDREFVNRCYRHELSKLVEAANLGNAIDAAMKADAQLSANWLVVKDWSIESRYSVSGQAKATAIKTAIADRRHGVMRWIRQHW